MTAPPRKRAPGGGRKPTIRGVKIAVTLTREHLTYIADNAEWNESRSATLRRLLDEHRQLGKELETLRELCME